MQSNKLINILLIILELYVGINSISAALDGDNDKAVDICVENFEVENKVRISDTRKFDERSYIGGDGNT